MWAKNVHLSTLSLRLRCWLWSFLLLLSACSGSGNYAPVAEGYSASQTPATVHVVRAGETLYSISWRYGLDYRQLADTNNITQPFTIYPGQRLALVASKKVTTPAVATTEKSRVAVSSANRNTTAPTPQPQAMPSTAAIHATEQKRYERRWLWPTQGNLLRRFSVTGDVHKGIDIQSKLGEPVLAAESGKVVYAGSGLVGYGNLLIVKHDDEYLSAYAHNSRLLVGEGEWVARGKQIAEVGDTGTTGFKLHFEIRRDGKPIDPLMLLPASR